MQVPLRTTALLQRNIQAEFIIPRNYNVLILDALRGAVGRCTITVKNGAGLVSVGAVLCLSSYGVWRLQRTGTARPPWVSDLIKIRTRPFITIDRVDPGPSARPDPFYLTRVAQVISF